MSPLIFIAIIAIVLINLAKKKNAEAEKKAAAARRAAAAAQAAAGGATQKPLQGQTTMTDADIFGTPDKPIRHAPAPIPARPATPAVTPAPAARPAATARPAPAARPAPERRADAYGSMDYRSTEGRAAGSAEGKSAWAEPRKTAIKSNLHVVKPVTESAHAHVESSISGIQSGEECEIEAYGSDSDVHDRAYIIGEDAGARQIVLNPANAAMAVLYSEILGKPRALRR